MKYCKRHLKEICVQHLSYHWSFPAHFYKKKGIRNRYTLVKHYSKYTGSGRDFSKKTESHDSSLTLSQCIFVNSFLYLCIFSFLLLFCLGFLINFQQPSDSVKVATSFMQCQQWPFLLGSVCWFCFFPLGILFVIMLGVFGFLFSFCGFAEGEGVMEWWFALLCFSYAKLSSEASGPNRNLWRLLTFCISFSSTISVKTTACCELQQNKN